MKTLNYNPKTAFPADMRRSYDPPEFSIVVDDQTYSLAKRIHSDYGTGIGEICAIIDRVNEQTEILQELKKRHDLSREIDSNTVTKKIDLPGGGTGYFTDSDLKISSISVHTKKGTFKISKDDYLFNLIKKRYTPSNRWDTSFQSAINTILYYLEFSTNLGTYQKNVITGLIAQHCGLYPKNKSLLSEDEYNSAEIEAKTYKAYLNQTVKTWLTWMK